MTRLSIEQTRLLNWADQTGLLQTSLKTTSARLGLNRNLIIDILLEIQAALHGCVKIQTEYDPFVKPAGSDSGPQQKNEGALAARSLLQRVIAISDKPSRVPSRLQWAMIKKDSFKTLVNRLIEYNDRIESFLDRNTLKDVHAMQLQSNIMLIQLTNEVAQLRLLSDAFKISRQVKGHDADQSSKGQKIASQVEQIESTAVELAQFKAEAALIERDILHRTPHYIPLSDIVSEGRDLLISHALGRYRNRVVWLEWREPIEDKPSSNVIQGIVHRRVKQLTALIGSQEKSPLFRTPSCLGYTCDDRDEEPQYALVYEVEHPPPSSFAGPRSLRRALSTLQMPSLGSRLALASMMAESLFYLHAVSWLHKGIRSDNVLFFQQESEGNANSDENTIDISSPVLSGFDFSRPDLIDEQTFRHSTSVKHDLYRHPDLIQFKTRRSRKSHDIYSLSIILIEVAFWLPIEETIGIEVRRSQVLEVSHRLATFDEPKNVLRSRLTAQVGEGYADVVSRCVVGGERIGAPLGSEETDPQVAAGMQESFFQNVVHRLQQLKV